VILDMSFLMGHEWMTTALDEKFMRVIHQWNIVLVGTESC